MPEGDSYTLAADRIRPVLVGRHIDRVDGSSPDVRRRSQAMLGAGVTQVRTIGKHLLIDLDNGLSIHIHLGMPGRVGLGNAVGERGALRLALTTDAGTVWVSAAPTVQVDRKKVIDHQLQRLGPDVLAPEFDWARYRVQASRYPDSATVSDFLLDQRVMAGVGNLYKCEVLFWEKLDPNRSMDTVDLKKRIALAQRARRLMLPNAHRSRRLASGWRRQTDRVFQRTGEPCRRCRSAIVEAWIGDPARITYWCPQCQT